uniref:HTH araC/xylS-type domain-containing protein n=1 Tax=Acrobeloides nanus TaxID=290746 RepID=A0A914D7Q4_9BILA
MIKRNPSTKVNSTRKLTKKLGISDFSARKILREDLGKKLFKFLKRQKLTDAAKLKRRKSMCETPLECGILEASFEEGMEQNHLGHFDQLKVHDRGQLPKRLKVCMDAKGEHFE